MDEEASRPGSAHREQAESSPLRGSGGPQLEDDLLDVIGMLGNKPR